VRGRAGEPSRHLVDECGEALRAQGARRGEIRLGKRRRYRQLVAHEVRHALQPDLLITLDAREQGAHPIEAHAHRLISRGTAIAIEMGAQHVGDEHTARRTPCRRERIQPLERCIVEIEIDPCAHVGLLPTGLHRRETWTGCARGDESAGMFRSTVLSRQSPLFATTCDDLFEAELIARGRRLSYDSSCVSHRRHARP
jgi:hypothetical protein